MAINSVLHVHVLGVAQLFQASDDVSLEHRRTTVSDESVRTWSRHSLGDALLGDATVLVRVTVS